MDHTKLTGKKILWVEDDKFLSDIIGRKFAAVNCTLIRAGSGDEVFSTALKQGLPDVMLLDLYLPGMSGFDILQKIKSDPATAKIPVVVLSNAGQSGDMDKAEKLGAAKFLVKATVSLDEILHQIEQFVA